MRVELAKHLMLSDLNHHHFIIIIIVVIMKSSGSPLKAGTSPFL